MDRNARRRQRYAEMSSQEKDELLRRRREAYAAKKTSPSNQPQLTVPAEKHNVPKKKKTYITRTALGHVETGVCFPDSGCPASSRDQSSGLTGACVHAEASNQPLPHDRVNVGSFSTGSSNAIGLDDEQLTRLFENVVAHLDAGPAETQASLLREHQHGSVHSGPCISSEDGGSFFVTVPGPTTSEGRTLQHVLIKPRNVQEDKKTSCSAKAAEHAKPTARARQARATAKRSTSCKPGTSTLNSVPTESMTLPGAPDCQYCGAKRFHLEPANFCCSGGEVSVPSPAMPYDLYRLLTGTDEESVEFRKNIRTYNNNLAFTTFGAKYDSELTKNAKGVYTFRVQGQVYHFLDSLETSGDRASGVQLYFFDTEEELLARLNSSEKLRESTLKLLMRVLSDNPYTKFFKDLRNIPDLKDHKILLNSDPGLDQRVYNLPTSSQVAGIWTESETNSAEKGPHIQVYSHSNTSHRIQHYYGCYDSLQYPLLFPRGETGWHRNIKRKFSRKRKSSDVCDDDDQPDCSSARSISHLFSSEEKAARAGKTRDNNVTAREYYCYKFQMRDDDRSMLLHMGRLLQQFAVDIYIKIETCRLDFHRNQQNEVRTEILQGVLDSLSIGETNGNKVGRKIVLPTSFVGGPRDMRRRYIDAMALVQKYGKPDYFLTMTCNTMWPEIQQNLKFDDKPQDRPDLLARVFRAKLEMLKHELINKKIFGEVAACVYVVEFQKRGLPHAHILLIMKPNDKPLNAEAYDRFVSAEIPDPSKNFHLYSLVIKHMMHGPCGDMNKKNACMKNGSCKNHYPKPFCEYTTHSEDGYPHYRRTDNGRSVKVRTRELDNRWVVPYNAYLLALFDCHLNVEVCSTIKLVKYLYKYVYKGHDLVSFHIASDTSLADIDEIKQFREGRWISPPEALWRIYKFATNGMNPSVYTLQVHLPGHQLISFNKNSDLLNLISKIDFSRTMLTQFFEMNRTNNKAQSLKCLYRDFPQHFVWSSKFKVWTERERHKVIGRLVSVNPNEGERYYLRLLLNHIRGPTSFEDLLTVNCSQVSSYREAALQLGLLNSDNYIVDTLEEAALFQMPSSLRFLFAVLLTFCSPNDPKLLWERFQSHMSRDFERSQAYTGFTSAQIKMSVLEDINKSLEQMGKSLDDYHLAPLFTELTHQERITKEIASERNITFPDTDLLLSSRLNTGQKIAYDIIMSSIFSSSGQSFFVDGPGGTGKTFLYRSLLATLRSQGFIALAVATSGVAASILPGGRTAHSRFKIPLDLSTTKTCQLSKQSSVAKLIHQSKLILWDEASMAKRDTIEAFDCLLRDIMECDQPFGGKSVVFGGDFRQTLPVIDNAPREAQVEASLLNSPLWTTLKKLKLSENMRAVLDPAFSSFLLRIGEGTERVDENGKVTLSPDMVVPYDTRETSLQRLLDSVYPDLHLYTVDPYQMISRCILSPTNSSVDDINSIMIENFPGESHVYTSTDKTLDERYQGDYEDFLNSQNPKGLPPHKLILKKNCPLILLRNLNPTEGLCNGTRLICRDLNPHTICVEIAVGHHKGKHVLLPKIPLQNLIVKSMASLLNALNFLSASVFQ